MSFDTGGEFRAQPGRQGLPPSHGLFAQAAAERFGAGGGRKRGGGHVVRSAVQNEGW